VASSFVEIIEETIRSGRARLPVFDQTAARAQAMLAEERYDVAELEGLAGGDPALSSALLRLSNSAFFGGLEKVVTLRDAVMRLGARKVAQLVVLLSQRSSYQVQDPALRRLAEPLWKHAAAAALGCDWLARKLELYEIERHAMLAGLLHDVGQLFLLLTIDDLKASRKLKFRPDEAFVAEVLHSLHGEHGERLLRAWNIPDVYCRVLRHHHDETFDDGDWLLAVVRLVDAACHNLGIAVRPRPPVVLASTHEAQLLRASEVALAELEVRLEDALQLAG